MNLEPTERRISLRLLRQNRGLTLHDVAQRAGVSPSYLSEFERDTMRRPRPDLLHRLADIFRLTDAERDELLRSYDVATSRTDAIVFVDGRWLVTWGHRKLSQSLGEHRPIEFDYDALLDVIREKLHVGCEITRKFFFATEPVKVHPADQAIAEAKIEQNNILFTRLRRKHRFDIVVVPADYKGRLRLRREDRRITDPPVNSPTPMALAAEVLVNVSIPDAFDIAVFVVGDAVYVPLIEAVRRRGKRVALVTIRVGCDDTLLEAANKLPIDFPPILIDDPEILNRIELKVEVRRAECKSALHRGERRVLTREPAPLDGSDYYCETCREKSEPPRNAKVSDRLPESLSRPDDPQERLVGMIAKIHHRGYGFIAVQGWGEFFFHASALPSGVEFFTLKRGDLVEFEPSIRPGEDPTRRQGAARKVVPICPQTSRSAKNTTGIGGVEVS